MDLKQLTPGRCQLTVPLRAGQWVFLKGISKKHTSPSATPLNTAGYPLQIIRNALAILCLPFWPNCPLTPESRENRRPDSYILMSCQDRPLPHKTDNQNVHPPHRKPHCQPQNCGSHMALIRQSHKSLILVYRCSSTYMRSYLHKPLVSWKFSKSQVANTRPVDLIRPSTLFYLARHLISTWSQCWAPCPKLRSSYIYTVLKLYLALWRQLQGWLMWPLVKMSLTSLL